MRVLRSTRREASLPPPSSPKTPISIANEIVPPLTVSHSINRLIYNVNNSNRDNFDSELDYSEPLLAPGTVVYYGRLQDRLPAWRRLASPFICDWIQNENGVL